MKPTASTPSGGWAGAWCLPGWATTITDPEHIARYEQLLHPWVNMTMDTMIAIQPEIVTGIRIIDTPTPEHGPLAPGQPSQRLTSDSQIQTNGRDFST